jgi:hypothetical protein
VRGGLVSELCEPEDDPAASSQVHARQRDTRTLWEGPLPWALRRPLLASACAELPRSHLLSFVIHSTSFAAGLALKAGVVRRRRARLFRRIQENDAQAAIVSVGLRQAMLS